MFIINTNTNIDQRIEEIIKSLNQLDYDSFNDASVTLMKLIESTTFYNLYETNFFKETNDAILTNQISRFKNL